MTLPVNRWRGRPPCPLRALLAATLLLLGGRAGAQAPQSGVGSLSAVGVPGGPVVNRPDWTWAQGPVVLMTRATQRTLLVLVYPPQGAGASGRSPALQITLGYDGPLGGSYQIVSPTQIRVRGRVTRNVAFALFAPPRGGATYVATQGLLRVVPQADGQLGAVFDLTLSPVTGARGEVTGRPTGAPLRLVGSALAPRVSESATPGTLPY